MRFDVVAAPYPLSSLFVIAFCLLSIVKCVIMMYYSGRMFDNDIILSIDSAWRYQKKFKPIVRDCLFCRFPPQMLKWSIFMLKQRAI